jgi:subfamily B ATP-binding cassette protein MsbA
METAVPSRRSPGSYVMSADTSLREKARAIRTAATYRPKLTAGIVLTNLLLAALEGIGLGFILPIVEQARSQGPASTTGVVGYFARAYRLLGVPFTLEYIIGGVALVMVVRVGAGFVSGWLTVVLQTAYVRDLKARVFEGALNARVGFFDDYGSDEVLDVIVTQVYYAESVVEGIVDLVQRVLLSGIYLLLAVALEPRLTAVLVVGSVAVVALLRYPIRSGYEIGSRVRASHREVQHTVQGAIQGIREVKSFGMGERLLADFRGAIDRYAESTIELGRNQMAMQSAYQLLTVLTVLGAIYYSLRYTSLSLGGLGVFFFAVYRLAPQINGLNGVLYELNGSLPHLNEVYRAIETFEANAEPSRATVPVPERVDRIAVENVSFSYGAEPVVRNVSVSFERGELVAFVGPSGAGKSTFVSLLPALYRPDSGSIEADGMVIDRFDPGEWRSRVSMVRQDPYLFDETLEYNLTLGTDVPRAELDRVCEIARVSEFVGDLPQGYGTTLGEGGVRLSGGQRQRVAIARALLKDADVLVLDEATSETDAALEAAIYEEITAMDHERATVVVTHRLSTITDADRIYAMEAGRLVERGPHRELIANNDRYAELYTREG